VLTDQRIIFLASSAMLGKPTDEVVAAIPRAAILAVSEDRKKGLGMTFDLALEGQQSGVWVVQISTQLARSVGGRVHRP